MVSVGPEIHVAKDAETRFTVMRARVYLATLFLVCLINFNYVLVHRYIVRSLPMKILNYAVAIYAVALLGYSTYWFWRSRKQERRRALQALRFYLATLLLVCLVNCNSIIINRYVVTSLPMRAFHFSILLYSIGLFTYSTYWFWATSRYESRRMHALESLKDSLTEVLDWEGLCYWLEHGPGGAPVRRASTRLVYVDLVGMHRINAEHGQPFGDSVLRGIGRLLSSKTPEGCTVGRIGGDEFMVIMPGWEEERAQQFGDTIATEIDSFVPEGASRGDMDVLKARVSVIPFIPEHATLTEAMAEARMQGALPVSTAPTLERERLGCHAVPHVTLGACALFLWDELAVPVRNQFAMWREAPRGEFLNGMADDLVELLSLRAEDRPFDFVTAPPAPPAPEKREPAQFLAERVAERLEVPYHQVLVPSAVASVVGYSEPKVSSTIPKGAYVLLVADLIEAGTALRSSVKKLSEAGASVQVVAWAARRPEPAS